MPTAKTAQKLSFTVLTANVSDFDYLCN